MTKPIIHAILLALTLLGNEYEDQIKAYLKHWWQSRKRGPPPPTTDT